VDHRRDVPLLVVSVEAVRRQPLPRSLVILVGLAAATVTVAGMKAASGIIAPTFLALVLMITVYPIRLWLVAKGVPAWLAAVVTILAVYLIVISMIVAMVVSIGKLAALVPQYAPQLNDVPQSFGDWLAGLGVKQEQVDAITGSVDVGKIFGLATTILSSALGVLSDLVFIGTLTLFIAFDAGRYPRILAAAEGEHGNLGRALIAFAQGTRTYFAVSAAFGLIVAVIDTIALELLGVPGAIVWGVLAFVTNFVPNIGFVIGLVPPAVLALLDGGFGKMVVVVALYCAINFIIQSIIQPKFVADALDLSTSLTFLSLVFWTFVLGPLGAILALPMTLLVRAVLIDADASTRWVNPLLSGTSPPEPDGA
jgi:AI-2 transport protein TqsA